MTSILRFDIASPLQARSSKGQNCLRNFRQGVSQDGKQAPAAAWSFLLLWWRQATADGVNSDIERERERERERGKRECFL